MKHTRNRGKEPRKLLGNFKNRLEILVSQNNSKRLETKPFHPKREAKGISFFNSYTFSSKVTRQRKKLVLISHQIPRTEFQRFVWWSVKRIKGLIMLVELLCLTHESHRYKFILYSHTEVIISHALYASYFKFCFLVCKLYLQKLFILLSLVTSCSLCTCIEHFPTVQIFMHSYP